MDRRLVAGIAFLAALAGHVPDSAGESREEAARRLQQWRTRLQAADRASAAGNLDAAEDHLRAVALEASAAGDGRLLRARAEDGLADLLLARGRLAEAERLYEGSVRLWEELLGPVQPRLATSLHNLGVTRLLRGRPQRAAEALSRALTIWEATLGPTSPAAEGTRAALRRARSSAPSD